MYFNIILYENHKDHSFPSLIVTSCQVTNDKENNQIKTFDLKELPTTVTVKLSDLGFDDIEYIPLETNKKCMIPRIREIKVGDGYFLIQYYTTIFKFKFDGSYVTKIGTEGRGPTEFLVAHDLDIDERNQNIYVVSGYEKKFNIYSENGEFLKTFHCPQNTTNFRITNEGILCYSVNTTGIMDNSYNFIDTAGIIIKVFPNRYPYKGNSNTIFYEHENIFYRFNNRLFKKEVYSDTIYVFEDMIFKPYLVINQGKKLLTADARSSLSPLDLFKEFISQYKLLEFGEYIYYEFAIGFELFSFIGSKKKNFVALSKYSFQTKERPGEGFINDLDGGFNVLPRAILDNNTIVCWIDALQLKTHITTESFKNSTPKYPEKKKELEKLANSLKETDNPVLMILRLKK